MTKLETRQTGFGLVGVIAIVFVISAVVGISYMFMQKKDGTKATTNPTSGQETRQPMSDTVAQSEEKESPYEGMMKYVNEKYAISFYYPTDWKIEEVPNDNASGILPVILGVNIKTASTEKYSEAATFEVISKDYKTVVSEQERIKRQSESANLTKEPIEKSGKQGVKLTANPSKEEQTNNKSVVYLFPGEGNTYAFSSTNEWMNVERDKDYWSKIDTIFQSMELR